MACSLGQYIIEDMEDMDYFGPDILISPDKLLCFSWLSLKKETHDSNPAIGGYYPHNQTAVL